MEQVLKQCLLYVYVLLFKCQMERLGRSTIGQMVGNILEGYLLQIDKLVQIFTGRSQSYSFGIKLTFSRVHGVFKNLVYPACTSLWKLLSVSFFNARRLFLVKQLVSY